MFPAVNLKDELNFDEEVQKKDGEAKAGYKKHYEKHHKIRTEEIQVGDSVICRQ